MTRIAPDFPFRPASLPFFYGWVIVAVATIGIVMSVPGQTMGVSVFTDHLIAVTGLSRLELSYTYLAGTLASSLLLPRGGTFLDRHGSRVTGIFACALVAVTLVLLTRIDRLAGAFGEVPSTWVAAAGLTFGFMFLRFSGQGMLTMSARTMMAKWFERRRGLASGLSGVFVSGGFAIAPLVLQLLIDAFGWRGAWLVLAGAVGFGMALVILVFFRETPESCGLRMDGRSANGEGAGAATDGPPGSERTDGESEEAPSYTREEALATARFWYVTAALALHAMVFTGVTFHIMDLGVETGIGGRDAVKLFIPNAIVSTSMGMLIGWASDRISVRNIVLAFVTLQTLAFVGAGRLGEPVFMAMMVLSWGSAGGCFATLMNVAVPNFFGRAHIGAISSVQMSCMVAGSALGPALLAAAKTYLGSYRVGLLGCSALSLAVFLFALLAPSPQPSREA